LIRFGEPGTIVRVRGDRLAAVFVAFVIVVGGTAAAASAAPSYQATTISDFTTGVCPGGAFSPHGSGANAVNNLGRVVGWAAYNCDDGSERALAFEQHNGVVQQLPLFGGWLSWAFGINDSNQIALTGTTVPGFGFTFTLPRAFLYANGSATDLGVLNVCGGCLPSALSFARGINDRGDVVGYSNVLGIPHAFLYDGTTLNDLGTLGGPSSRAFGLNNHRQVVGESTPTGSTSSHAFLYQSGTMIDLGTLGGAASAAYAINAFGTIVGEAQLADGSSHAFAYANGSMSDLGTLGGQNSVARGINRWGQIVGASQTASGAWHAFVVTGGVMLDLNTLATGAAGVLVGANAINDFGRVVGDQFVDPSATGLDIWPAPNVSPFPQRGFDAPSGDTTAPTCAVHGAVFGPNRKAVRYTIRDDGSGLVDVVLEDDVNAQLDATFTTGTTDSVSVTVNRVDTQSPWSFTVRVRDTAGNTAVCPS
jgi:probable HAF family extracellular repeat protein